MIRELNEPNVSNTLQTRFHLFETVKSLKISACLLYSVTASDVLFFNEMNHPFINSVFVLLFPNPAKS